jgi:hypothetical protein
MKKCPFCEGMVSEFHPGSHIIPKWMHKLSFGNQSRTYNVDLHEQTMEITQDGVKGSFICHKCEIRFSKDDQYGSYIFKPWKNPRGPNVNVAQVKVINSNAGLINAVDLKNLNFKRMQKFILSVILRGHMYLTQEGRELLGEKHFSKIRTVYSNESNLDDSIYPILINKIDTTDPLWNTVIEPYRGRGTSGMNLVSFTGGGYQFHVVVQGHNPAKEAIGFRLKSDGTAIIPIIKIAHTRPARETLKSAKQLKRH